MPESGLNHFRMFTLLDQQRRMGVPEIVESQTIETGGCDSG